jgi:hypothetical protein
LCLRSLQHRGPCQEYPSQQTLHPQGVACRLQHGVKRQCFVYTTFSTVSTTLPPEAPDADHALLSMVSQLIDHLDLSSTFDVAVAACTTTAFWGQFCLGELLPSSASILLSHTLWFQEVYLKPTILYCPPPVYKNPSSWPGYRTSRSVCPG